eukprot:CAMPEP_0181386778 /NCGR_PEP_ID=MMETSP1106-20121128/23335_1 /TAXON_ID=81844 /ORGANISM="Mantoniella antarctica, Strain SL-175" /LENGTH=921 /DNA_ID=CAMNT_0023507049 /DNA_START=232 /DNA_END=2997 /DNA_ORIENTATION=+
MTNALSGALLLALVFLTAVAGGVRAQPGLQQPLRDGVAVTGSLEPGQTTVYTVNARGCKGFLHVESWDTKRLRGPVTNKADQMLLVRYDLDPQAQYTSNNEWRWTPDTLKDIEGYKLLRPYHHVSVDMRPCARKCAAKCAASSDPNCAGLCAGQTCSEPKRDADYKVGIYNVELWMSNRIDYMVVATCLDEGTPPCPRPMLIAPPPRAPAVSNASTMSPSVAGMCGGDGRTQGANGKCNAAKDASGNTDFDAALGVCACDPGFGDVGCDKILTPLVNGVSRSGAIAVGEWSYYDFDVLLPTGVGSNTLVTMLVELERIAGDPVLFVKRVDDPAAGLQGGVPAVSDYADFADTEGFRSRVNYHFRLLENVVPGRYYVAVFNNDVYIESAAQFTLTARYSLPSITGRTVGPTLCPANCSAPQGTCTDAQPAAGMSTAASISGGGMAGGGRVGVCECRAGFGGRMCEGTLASVTMGMPVAGTLQPGGWAYVKFNVPREVADAGISVTFQKDGGHPVLILRRGGFPTLLDNSYVFSTTENLERESTFKISPRDLSPGEYIIGVFNMNYYVNSECSYAMVVSPTEDGFMMVTPSFMSIILVVIMSMFLCLLLSVCKRLLQRGAGRRSLRDILMGREARDPEFGGVAMGGMSGNGRAQPVGCSHQVINAIPQSVFNKQQWEAGDWAKEDASCSVCIEAFEEGDDLRSLPSCQHVFHKACIDEWLAQHTTCPNCRASLVPVPDVPALGTGLEATSGGEADDAGEVVTVPAPRPAGPVLSPRRTERRRAGYSRGGRRGEAVPVQVRGVFAATEALGPPSSRPANAFDADPAAAATVESETEVEAGTEVDANADVNEARRWVERTLDEASDMRTPIRVAPHLDPSIYGAASPAAMDARASRVISTSQSSPTPSDSRPGSSASREGAVTDA